MSESAYKCFEIGKANFLQTLGKKMDNLDTANQPRQLFPKTYVANGYVDVLSAAFVEEKKMIHGKKVLAFETPVTVEIDTEDDFDYIEFQLSRNMKVKQNLFG
jgi:CMP-N-acetylneuraminic acid synthetase